MEIGTQIKEARKKSGLSQVDLAEKTGLTQKTISLVERTGETSVATLVIIAKVLKTEFIIK